MEATTETKPAQGRKLTKAEIARIKKNRKKWVAALRSGKFQQGRSELKQVGVDANDQPITEPQYCCLGVAGQVCGLPEKKLLGKSFLEHSFAFNKLGLTEHDTPGDDYIEDYIEVDPCRQQSFLANLNDDGKTFKQIARYIEKLPIPTHRPPKGLGY